MERHQNAVAVPATVTYEF